MSIQQGAEVPTRADGRTHLKSRSKGAHRKPGMPSGTGRAAAALATMGLAIAGLGLAGTAAQAAPETWSASTGGFTSGATPTWLGIYSTGTGLYGACGLEGTKPGPETDVVYGDPSVLTTVTGVTAWGSAGDPSTARPDLTGQAVADQAWLFNMEVPSAAGNNIAAAVVDLALQPP